MNSRMSKQNKFADTILSSFYLGYSSSPDTMLVLRTLLNEGITLSKHHASLYRELLELNDPDKIIACLNTKDYTTLKINSDDDFVGIMKAFFAYYPDYYLDLNAQLQAVFKPENPLPHYFEHELKRLQKDEKQDHNKQSITAIKKYYPLPTNTVTKPGFFSFLFSPKKPEREQKLSDLYVEGTDHKPVIQEVIAQLYDSLKGKKDSLFFYTSYWDAGSQGPKPTVKNRLDLLNDYTLGCKNSKNSAPVLLKKVIDTLDSAQNDAKIVADRYKQIRELQAKQPELVIETDEVGYGLDDGTNIVLGIGLLGLLLKNLRNKLDSSQQQSALSTLRAFLQNKDNSIKLLAHFALEEAGESGFSDEKLSQIIPEIYKSYFRGWGISSLLVPIILKPFFNWIDATTLIHSFTSFRSTDACALTSGLFRLHSPEIKQHVTKEVDEATGKKFPPELTSIITRQLGL